MKKMIMEIKGKLILSSLVVVLPALLGPTTEMSAPSRTVMCTPCRTSIMP